MATANKPNFRRSSAFSFGSGNLKCDESRALLHCIPVKMKRPETMDNMRDTDAQRVLRSIDEALGWYTAPCTTSEAVANVIQDVRAIGTAAEKLLEAIRRASIAARTTIDEEAIYYSVDPADARLSVTGKLCVDWHGGLESVGLRNIAEQIHANGSRDFGEHERSLLSRLWDLAEDARRMAEDAGKRQPTPDRNRKVDRLNAQRLAQHCVVRFVENMARKLPPKSDWYFDLVATAGRFRGLVIGKDTVRAAIDSLSPLDSEVG